MLYEEVPCTRDVCSKSKKFMIAVGAPFRIFLYNSLYSNIDIFDNYFLFHKKAGLSKFKIAF